MVAELDILLIEDNQADVRTLHRVLEQLQYPWTIEVLSNGQCALRYLKELIHDRLTPPNLILLDLNLPRVHGLEVLKQFKEHKEMRNVPVIVLTTSLNQDDLERARELGIEAFIRKPDRIDQWRNEILPRLQDVV